MSIERGRVGGVSQEEVDASVEKNMAALRPVLDKPFLSAIEKVGAIIHGGGARKVKVKALYEVVDKLGDIIGHHTPCKKGCHHCCHMGVLVGPSEAKLIEDHTGIKRAKLAPEDDLAQICLGMTEEESKQWELRHTNTDCPFLADGVCSIYPVRPMNCRLYNNISDYPELCDLRRGMASVPVVNMSMFHRASLIVQGVEGVADIRSYFPKVKAGKAVE